MAAPILPHSIPLRVFLAGPVEPELEESVQGVLVLPLVTNVSYSPQRRNRLFLDVMASNKACGGEGVTGISCDACSDLRQIQCRAAQYSTQPNATQPELFRGG